MSLPSGLSYLADYVSAEEAVALLAAVDAQPWMNDLRRRSDVYDGARRQRSRRVSLTFRTILAKDQSDT